MDKILFEPHQMQVAKNIVLIPQFWDSAYFDKIKENALATLNLLGSDILLFEQYTLIVGFLGYPHILTLLEFIKDAKEKNIYFLGTAGSMNETINEPIPLNVSTIHSTAILDHFAETRQFPLKTFETGGFRKATGVTVDIIQRETLSWLREQKKREIDFVEMELFPLRAYLQKPFYAIVVTSDILRETGVDVFINKQQLRKEFVKSYEFIIKHICG